MVVLMQVPRAAATKSVGEKLSPLPRLSVGASVEISDLDGPWTASQCSSPVYLTETSTIFVQPQINTDLHRFRNRNTNMSKNTTRTDPNPIHIHIRLPHLCSFALIRGRKYWFFL